MSNRPQWFTVAGGARQYVQKIVHGLDARLGVPVQRIVRDAAGVQVHTEGHSERFDAVVLAVHSDQALRLLAQPTAQESQVLGAIRYQPNRAVLHTDDSVMPRRRSAWAAWNYERAASSQQESARVCLHYWLNRLQPLPFAQPVLVSLNPARPIARDKVLAEFDYDHPVFDLPAIAAQDQVPLLQGTQRTWYCGAWTGYGFHEDGLQSGYRAADLLLEQLQAPGGRMTAPAPAPALAAHRPHIGFGHVWHTRLRPRRHRFIVPTFFLLLPMRTLRTQPEAAGVLALNRPGALAFRDADHGDGRSPEQGGALAWLEALLHSEGIDGVDGEIWLHCYPRVLGYSFKPVSFGTATAPIAACAPSWPR